MRIIIIRLRLMVVRHVELTVTIQSMYSVKRKSHKVDESRRLSNAILRNIPTYLIILICCILQLSQLVNDGLWVIPNLDVTVDEISVGI